MDLENPEWLPEDWKVVVEVRDYGKKYKYYINKSNGQRFYSKPDLLRYLESSEKKPEKLNKIDIERTVAENLPTGWIKETRTKKKGGKTRNNEFYIDPDTGHYFNSLLQVFRYLETKDSGKPESKPDDKDQIKAEVEDPSQFTSAEAKGQMSIDKKEVRRSTRRKSVESELELAGDSKGDTVNNVEQKEDINIPETNASDQIKEESVTHPNKSKRSISKWKSDLPRRFSKRLAHGAVGPLFEVQTAEVNGKPNLLVVSEITSTGKSGNFIDSNDHPTESSTCNKQKEPITSLKEDLSCIHDQERVVEIKEDQKEFDASLNDLTADPCIDYAFKILTDAIPMELAIKTLTSVIPIEDVKKGGENAMSSMASPNNQTSTSSSVLPCDDVWTDPCFECAIKMFIDKIAKDDGLSNNFSPGR